MPGLQGDVVINVPYPPLFTNDPLADLELLKIYVYDLYWSFISAGDEQIEEPVIGGPVFGELTFDSNVFDIFDMPINVFDAQVFYMGAFDSFINEEELG